MVEVFREVRRVLTTSGTVWLNLGDSYNAGRSGGWAGGKGSLNERRDLDAIYQNRSGPNVADLKPKDLVGIPWRVAFALQADGWYLRSDIIWAKPNPMPESVTDRPTKAHEYVFLLSKNPRYFFDQEAVREKAEWARWGNQTNGKHEGSESAAGWIGAKSKTQLQGGRQARRYSAEEFKTTDERNTRFQGPNPVDGGRNIRSVWEIATQPYPEAHFATFPEELARRCIAAGCPERVCGVCGKASERIVDVSYGKSPAHGKGSIVGSRGVTDRNETHLSAGMSNKESIGVSPRVAKIVDTLGFTDCGHNAYAPGTVLDPFIGSGTVAFVARKLHRRSIGIDLSADYLDLAAKRLQQQSLFAGDVA
jgi:DNA modification methylase